MIENTKPIRDLFLNGMLIASLLLGTIIARYSVSIIQFGIFAAIYAALGMTVWWKFETWYNKNRTGAEITEPPHRDGAEKTKTWKWRNPQ